MNLPLENQIWSAKQVADYLGVCPRQVRERYSIQPGFPEAIRLGHGSRSPIRWKAADILNWVEGMS